jgi:hypothetical protein
VLEDVTAAIDARAFAVPHAEDAVVFRLGEEGHLLAAPDRGRREVLVDAGLEADMALLQVLFRPGERLVQAAEGRPAVAGNESSGIEPGHLVACALQHE